MNVLYRRRRRVITLFVPKQIAIRTRSRCRHEHFIAETSWCVIVALVRMENIRLFSQQVWSYIARYTRVVKRCNERVRLIRGRTSLVMVVNEFAVRSPSGEQKSTKTDNYYAEKKHEN
jgi:hypothetical protein